jgi:hypothetical protein
VRRVVSGTLDELVECTIGDVDVVTLGLQLPDPFDRAA